MAANSTASAVTYTLVGDGSNQYLTWLWEYSPASGCLSSGTCGNEFSTNGKIALNNFRSSRTLSGGMLDWTNPGDSLKVVALTTVAAHQLSGHWANAWGAVDVGGREPAVPLLFRVDTEIGDPFDLDLQILPRLVGTANLLSNPGAFAELQLQMMMAVTVNGEQVSRDSLYAVSQVSGTNSFPTLALPKGAANNAIVSGVPSGSEVQVTIWAYMRAYVSGSASIDAFSSYGEGPAIEIVVRPLNVVAVADETAPDGLWLGMRPNPSLGTTRVAYALPRASQVRLSIYDIRGGRVATLVDRIEDAGRREVTWNARDSHGEPLAPGIYVVELVAGAHRTIGKLAVTGR